MRLPLEKERCETRTESCVAPPTRGRHSWTHNSRRAAALPRPEADSGSTGARAGAILAPGAPGAVLLDLIRVLPHAVTFVAPLQRRTGEHQDAASHFQHEVLYHHSVDAGEPIRRRLVIRAQDVTDLSRVALGPVQRGPLLGFAEVRVVRVAAPQLLARVEGAELERGGENLVTSRTPGGRRRKNTTVTPFPPPPGRQALTFPGIYSASHPRFSKRKLDLTFKKCRQ